MLFKKSSRVTDGGPMVKRDKDKDGNLQYTVYAYILNPWVAFGLDILRPIIALMLAVGGVYFAATHPTEPEWWVYPIIIVTPLVFYWPIRKILYAEFEQLLTFTIRKDTLTVKYLTMNAVFETNIDYKVVQGKHPWAQALGTRLNAKKRNLLGIVESYPAATAVIMLEGMGVQKKLANVFLHRAYAEKITENLNAYLREFDGKVGNLQGHATRPEDDWGDTTGGLSALGDKS
jgi:hypothetical protein